MKQRTKIILGVVLILVVAILVRRQAGVQMVENISACSVELNINLLKFDPQSSQEQRLQSFSSVFDCAEKKNGALASLFFNKSKMLEKIQSAR